jgi:hypothetical protein
MGTLLAREQENEIDIPERQRRLATKKENEQIVPCMQKKRIPELQIVDVAVSRGVSRHV